MNEDELINTKLQLRGTAILSLNFNNSIFYDSYCFLSKSLDSLCKGFKINKCKLKEFNYKGKILSNYELCFYKPDLNFYEFLELEHKEPEYWGLYVKYCLYDCIALGEIWMKFKTQFNIMISYINCNPKYLKIEDIDERNKILVENSMIVKKCRIEKSSTISGLSKKIFLESNKYYKKGFKEYTNNFSLESIYKFIDTEEKYKFLCNFKIGGISHCNQPGIYNINSCSFDIRS